MSSYLISPPAVERVVPPSKPLGTAPVHISVSAVHSDLIKPTVQAPVSGPTYIVTLPKTQ